MQNFGGSLHNVEKSNGTNFIQEQSGVNNGTSGVSNSFAPWVHALIEVLKPSTLNAPGLPDENKSEFRPKSFVPKEYIAK